ncbi:uncharacterized protein LOC126576733 [Anopheles aquasalis]|uniref:uncharacterized protein LOC126576733 n=1 Tax=Anopheles aquasalis TaxID=42839 RepID=UPI00215AF290|nr:uncharacterized protein LOC126576733 [Anopheles aquasalis]
MACPSTVVQCVCCEPQVPQQAQESQQPQVPQESQQPQQPQNVPDGCFTSNETTKINSPKPLEEQLSVTAEPMKMVPGEGQNYELPPSSSYPPEGERMMARDILLGLNEFHRKPSKIRPKSAYTTYYQSFCDELRTQHPEGSPYPYHTIGQQVRSDDMPAGDPIPASTQPENMACPSTVVQCVCCEPQVPQQPQESQQPQQPQNVPDGCLTSNETTKINSPKPLEEQLSVTAEPMKMVPGGCQNYELPPSSSYPPEGERMMARDILLGLNEFHRKPSKIRPKSAYTTYYQSFCDELRTQHPEGSPYPYHTIGQQVRSDDMPAGDPIPASTQPENMACPSTVVQCICCEPQVPQQAQESQQPQVPQESQQPQPPQNVPDGCLTSNETTKINSPKPLEEQLSVTAEPMKMVPGEGQNYELPPSSSYPPEGERMMARDILLGLNEFHRKPSKIRRKSAYTTYYQSFCDELRTQHPEGSPYPYHTIGQQVRSDDMPAGDPIPASTQPENMACPSTVVQCICCEPQVPQQAQESQQPQVPQESQQPQPPQNVPDGCLTSNETTKINSPKPLEEQLSVTAEPMKMVPGEGQNYELPPSSSYPPEVMIARGLKPRAEVPN